MKRIGLLVNPIAGMGGKIGFKGTDGYKYSQLTNKFHVKRISDKRCKEALNEILSIRDSLEIITYGREMGEDILKDFPFKYKVAGNFSEEDSNSLDTIKGAQAICNYGVDILVFAGGDGTARNIYEALGTDQVVLGIPSGVKMHSSVYGITPKKTGELLKEFLTSFSKVTVDGEVMDIDEDLYREGKVFPKLYGYLKVPYSRKFMQGKKTGTAESERYIQDSIAADVIEHMSDEFQYLIGPGSTTAMIMKRMKLENTLIGLDLVFKKKIVKMDLNEEDILQALKNPTKLIITPTGGQGFLLGRGNQQISSKVLMNLKKEDIIIVATKNKLLSYGNEPLRVDLEEEAREHISGYYKVISGYDEAIIKKIG